MHQVGAGNVEIARDGYIVLHITQEHSDVEIINRWIKVLSTCPRHMTRCGETRWCREVKCLGLSRSAG